MSTTATREFRKHEHRVSRFNAGLARSRRAWIEHRPVKAAALDGWTLDGAVWHGPNGERLRAIAGGYDGGATIIIALTVLAAAASAYATYSSSQAQKSAYDANAAESERQAEMADQAARFKAQQQVEADRRTRAKARAIGGTSGVAAGEGSSLLVDLDSAKQAELNFQSIRYEGESEVRALRAQATIDRFKGRQAGQQGMIGAGASLLGGLSKAYTPKTAAPKAITVPA